MSDCVFCRIIKGESPGSIFYEDDVVFGVMDISPITTGHIVIIPKAHIPFLGGMDEETGRHLWTIAQRTAAAIRESGVLRASISSLQWRGRLSGNLPRTPPCFPALQGRSIQTGR